MHLSEIKNSPTLVRIVPFGIFLALTFCQSYFGETGRYSFYAAKTVIGAWMIWAVRPFIPEMRWQLSWEAILIGVVVFVLWVGLDGLYPSLNQILNYMCPFLKKAG